MSVRYSFITVATNDLGDSLASSEARFTVTSLPQKPQSVLRSSMSTRTQLTVQLAVEPDTDAPISGYVLEIDSTGDGYFMMLWNGTGRPDILSYTLTVITG